MSYSVRILLAFVLTFSDLQTPALAEESFPVHEGFMTGADANYSSELAEHGVSWKVDGKQADLFKELRKAGMDRFRVRVWTGEEGPSGRSYAGALAKQAQNAGLKPYLVFFLSEGWSDYVKQPAPLAWQSLSFEEKLAKVADYSESTARYFKSLGVEIDLFEIGNEIDFGICGVFEEAWEKRFDFTHMQEQIWRQAAAIIRAAQQGIRRVNPRAKFILHLTQWWNPEFCTIFLETMLRHGVQVDFLGLSYFPSSGLSEQQSFADLGKSVGQIFKKTGRPVLICEYAYPSLPNFGGQFASWNKPVAGYPLDESGQKKWIADFLSFCRGHRHIKGAFYWSPEWYSEEMWKAFALFRADGNAKEGLRAFGQLGP